MKAQQQIKEALKKIMSEGEANACQVFKGYDVGTGLTGWHFIRFGSTATYLGDNLPDALETIDRIEEERAAGW